MSHEAPLPPEPTMCYSDDPDEQAELGRLFGSTDPLDSLEARRLCLECYFRDSCGRLAARVSSSPEGRWAGIPSGTWGGVLFINGKPAHEWHKPKRRRESAGASS